MITGERLLVPWVIGLCSVAAASGFAVYVRPGERWLRRLADALALICSAAALALWMARWWSVGHLPLFGTYESALSLSLAVLAAAVVSRYIARVPWAAGPVACAVTALLLIHGLQFDPTAFPLTISERSWVVDAHAIFAWGAFGTLTANAGFAVWCLADRRAPDRAAPALSRSLSAGFMLHSLMMASGSVYKFLLFGTAWSFDPIETLGFVTWISYGTLLHMHLFARWEGRRLARWSLGLFVILVVSYRGIVYFPAWSTYHIFDMDLRMHMTGSETLNP